jgi:hypothetical protein
MRDLTVLSLFAAAAVIVTGAALAQTAGSQTIGVTVTEVRIIAEGWSVKYSLLDKPVYNLQKEKIGTVDDLIVAPDSSVSYGILAVGGFLGIGTRDVAIPIEQFEMRKDGTILLPGADKEALEAMPPFQYARSPR